MKDEIMKKLKIDYIRKGFIKIIFSIILICCSTSALFSQKVKSSRANIDLNLDINSLGLENIEKVEVNNSRNISLKFGAGYFIPSEQSFKDVYSGGMTVGGEINIKLWKFIDLWLSGNYYSQKGNLPVTGEETTMRLIPIGGGLKLRFREGIINPYLGFGSLVCFYKETNPIGVAEGTGVGVIGQVGCFFKITGGLLFDLSLNYSYCTVKPQKIKADIGGIQAGISLGYEF